MGTFGCYAFFTIGSPISWQGAYEYCIQLNMTLLNIETAVENIALTNHLVANESEYNIKATILCTIWLFQYHYSDPTMIFLASQTTSDSTVCLTVCLDLHQRKHQNPRYWPFVRGIHRWPVECPLKGPVTRQPFHLMKSSWTWAMVECGNTYLTMKVGCKFPLEQRGYA